MKKLIVLVLALALSACAQVEAVSKMWRDGTKGDKALIAFGIAAAGKAGYEMADDNPTTIVNSETIVIPGDGCGHPAFCD